MDKAKRKGQPANLNRYWKIFLPLLVIAIIPIRFSELWWLTQVMYFSITLVSLIALVKFIYWHGWQYAVTIVMFACMMLSLFQMVSYRNYWIYECNPYPDEQGFVQSVLCSEGCETDQHILTLGKSGIGIQTYFGRYVPYCLY